MQPAPFSAEPGVSSIQLVQKWYNNTIVRVPCDPILDHKEITMSKTTLITKALLTAAIALAFMLSVGCAPKTPEPPSEVALTFWKHSHTPADDLSKIIIDEYMKANPNVKITLEIVPTNQYFVKLLSAVVAGDAPDIFDTDDINLPILIDKGLMSPVVPKGFGVSTQDEFLAQFVPGSLNTYKGPDGKVYGIPFEFNTWNLMINERLFREAGLDPSVDAPKTWEEAGEIGKKLAVVTNGRFDRQGFTWNYVHSGWTMTAFSGILYQLGGSILTDDEKGNKSNLYSPEAIKALSIMRDMKTAYGACDPAQNISTGADQNADFIQEKAAMWITGPWAVPTFKANPAVYDSYRVVPLPQASDAKRKTVIMTSWGWGVNKNIDAAKQLEAWKFVNYASQQGSRWLGQAGYILPRLGWTESPEAKAFKGLDVFMETMAYGRPRLQHPKNTQIRDELHKAIQEVLLSGADPAASLKPASDAIDRILAE